MRWMKKAGCLTAGLILCAHGAVMAGETIGLFGVPVQGLDFEDAFEKKQWQEVVVQLPPVPRKESLVPFFVSAATEHRFFVDTASLSIGQDGVVRYTVVIETSAGANNTNYEGMRCETREWRHYASGRPDGTWSKARNSSWDKVREGGVNRYRAALFTDFFCPDGVINSRVEDIVTWLKRGGKVDFRPLGR